MQMNVCISALVWPGIVSFFANVSCCLKQEGLEEKKSEKFFTVQLVLAFSGCQNQNVSATVTSHQSRK